MVRFNKYHFYYGAILSALYRYNPDAKPVLLSHDDSRQVYKVMTNSSQECLLYFKYASGKVSKTNERVANYSFTFSDEEKQKLMQYSQNKQPLLLYLLCKHPISENSEIIVLRYDEYQLVQNHRKFVLKVQRGKKDALMLLGSGIKNDAYAISRDRLYCTFDDLLKN